MPFAERVARLGAQNSLAQTVLKLTLPGVPDIYQGTELWDLSMVDPDNRRPVDYGLRVRLLEQVSAELRADRPRAMRRYMESWQDARFKLATIATLLGCRREHPALFERGRYEPLEAQGPNADQLCAFLRAHDGVVLLTAVARFPARLPAAGMSPATTLALPDELRQMRWRDLLSGAERAGPTLASPDLFAALPAAVLVPA